MTTADKNGKYEDIMLGFDKLQDYINNPSPYFGALIGRYANRIAKGKFKLDGKEYTLAQNNGVNHLHGGIKGFDKVVWNAEELKDSNDVGLKLSYLSKDGEEGYPGNLKVSVTYKLTDNNELTINYEAETDKSTPVNLTYHGYFNLTAGKTDVLNHELMLNSDKYLIVNSSIIPTGEIANVTGTPFDFKTFHKIGERIAKVDGGYDNCFVINNYNGSLQLAAKAYEPESGRTLEVWTTEPGIQFYSGNFLDGKITGKNNIVYKQHYGFSLETSHYPDAPNQPAFPSTILKPGIKYHHYTVFKFGVKQ